METVTITLDGVEVSGSPGMTILELARKSGVNIPTLCHVPDLRPIGACRLCVVEVEGSRTLVASCHTPIAKGMIVRTNTPKVVDTRRIMVELMLASHPDSCLVCDKANLCELRRIAADLDIGLPRFRARKHYFPVEDENPYIIRDMSKCVLCRRCVAACTNIKGQKLFSVAYRGFDSKVICGLDQPLDKEVCRDCSACIDLCPTGALSKPHKVNEERAARAVFVKG